MPRFKVSRTIEIESDPETVFETLRDFGSWKTWSPWLLADNQATVTFHSDPTNVGGGFSWDGPVVGAGEMEHLELKPPSENHAVGSMHCQLRFTRPWKSQSNVDFEVKKSRQVDGKTVSHVRWDMAGSLPFFMFWMKPMMVSVLSLDYDRGLRMLKELIESGQVDSETVVHGITRSAPHRCVGLSGESTLAEIGPAIEATIGDLQKRLAKSGIATGGHWLTLYDDMCMKTQSVKYTCGLETDTPDTLAAGLVTRSVPAFQAMHVTHTGRYHHLGNAWSAAHQNLRAIKGKSDPKLPSLEVYRNSPDDTPQERLVTDVYLPVK